MPSDNSGRHQEKQQRNYSPQYDRPSDQRGLQISEAETSVDYHRDRRHYDQSRQSRAYEHSRDSSRKHKHHSKHRHHHRRDSFIKPDRRSRSFDGPNHSNHSFSRSRIIDHREDPRRQGSFYQKERERIESRECKELTQVDIQREKDKIMEEIQKIDYQALNYEQVREKFISCCGKHLKLLTDFPESTNRIGTLLLKDGLFHEMWNIVIFKNHSVPKDPHLQSYYVLFNPMIQKNLTNFEKTFNPIPEEEQTVSHKDSSSSFKRDRRTYEENTRSTTRMDVMIVYEQVKAEMKTAQIQETLLKKLQESVQEFRLKIDQSFQPIEDPYNIEWFDTAKEMAKYNAQEDQQRRQAQIDKIQRFRIREKSPLSHRFRMMHEVQSNQRRMAVEMACVFLRIDIFYNFGEIHIVKVDEIILSENQEIIVVKAYSLDFCPLMGKMKIEPKLKNLIAVYKFCNLTELARLEKTHGKFDGIIVYPECFNVQKYLVTSEQLSLLKSDCIEQIKEQIKNQIREQNQEY